MSACILITGASGLLGGALMDRLRSEGERVVGIDRSAPLANGRDVVIADILDVKAVAELCATFEVRKIVHAGGVSGRAVSRDDPVGTIRTNVMGTANVFEAASRFNVERVVLCSSGSVYGRSSDDPVRETTMTSPINAYGASKIAAEAIMHGYAADRGVNGVALRIFQVFGPRRSTRCHVRTMVQAALDGRPALVPHAAESRCQYLYVTDAVDALAAAIRTTRLSRSIYNIAGGTSLTLKEVAETTASVLPGLRVEFGDDPAGSEYCLGDIDISAAIAELGYRPQFSLGAGIAAYAEWMRTNNRSRASITNAAESG